MSPGRDAGILRIDHIVGNVELGRMNDWADWYSRVLGFKRYHQLRRQGHLDRIQRAHEHRHVRRLARDQVPDQRAGRGPAARARSRSISTTTAGRASSTSPCSRPTSSPPCRRCATAASSSCDVPETLLRRAADDASARSTKPSRRSASSASSSIATRRAICCSSSRSPVEDRPTLFFEIIQRKGSRGLRQGELQGALRGHRARAGTQGQPVTPAIST